MPGSKLDTSNCTVFVMPENCCCFFTEPFASRIVTILMELPDTAALLSSVAWVCEEMLAIVTVPLAGFGDTA